MRISDVADQTGIPISTIRYYEKRAIIPKPGRNGRERPFSRADIQAIEFVRDARSLGLSLAEISTLLQTSWANREMAKTAATYRRTIRERIAALERIDTVLAALEMCQCESFADCTMTTAPCRRAGG